jgi:hypothetical protein
LEFEYELLQEEQKVNDVSSNGNDTLLIIWNRDYCKAEYTKPMLQNLEEQAAALEGLMMSVMVAFVL